MPHEKSEFYDDPALAGSGVGFEEKWEEIFSLEHFAEQVNKEADDLATSLDSSGAPLEHATVDTALIKDEHGEVIPFKALHMTTETIERSPFPSTGRVLGHTALVGQGVQHRQGSTPSSIIF